MLRIVHISNTHSRHNEMRIPDGDILVHSGGFTRTGTKSNVEEFFEWFQEQPHTYKILTAGCSDRSFDRELLRDPNRPFWLDLLIRKYIHKCHDLNFYLENSSCDIWGIKFYGSPYAPVLRHGINTLGFTYARADGPKIHADIPKNTDVLITHAAPNGICDYVSGKGLRLGKHEGCEALLYYVKTIRPKLHLFGHISEANGISHDGDTMYSNACAIDPDTYRINSASVFDMDDDTKEVDYVQNEL